MSMQPYQIKAIRTGLGLTQGEFAKMLCISRVQVNNLERGRRTLKCKLRLGILDVIARAVRDDIRVMALARWVIDNDEPPSALIYVLMDAAYRKRYEGALEDWKRCGWLKDKKHRR